MEMEVRPIEADLQEDVKIGQGAVGSYEKAPPEHRVDPPNPDLDTVSFGLRIVFHYGASPIRWTTPRLFLAPGLKCSPPLDSSHDLATGPAFLISAGASLAFSSKFTWNMLASSRAFRS